MYIIRKLYIISITHFTVVYKYRSDLEQRWKKMATQQISYMEIPL